MDTPSSIFKKPHVEENAEAWLMSYADMITLLLCFFIIFVSTSEPKEDKLAAATRGMKARFGTVDLSTPFDGALRVVQGVIEQHKAFKAMAVQKTERGMTIELSTDMFFIANTAELVPAKLALLQETLSSFNTPAFQEYRIVVEGHSDDAPDGSMGAYPTGWELSGAQSARVVRLLEALGIPAQRLEVRAFGATRPKLANTNAKGEPIPENRDRNRRIVIGLERGY